MHTDAPIFPKNKLIETDMKCKKIEQTKLLLIY